MAFYKNDDEDDLNGEENNNILSIFLEVVRKKSSANSLVRGNRISAYYLPNLLPHAMRLCKHFPLWTNSNHKLDFVHNTTISILPTNISA